MNQSAFATSFCCFHAVISTIHSLVFKPMQPPMKCVYFYVLALTLAFPRDVRHVCPVVESVTSWGARCTRRVRVVPDVPLTLNKRKRARELLSQHIFGHISPHLILMSSRHHTSNNCNTYLNKISINKIIHLNTSSTF